MNTQLDQPLEMGQRPPLSPELGILTIILRAPVALAFMVPALYFAWTFPVLPQALTAGLALCVLLLLLWPPAWMLLLPAAIPGLVLGFWSGRIYFTEFDMLLMATFGAVYWRRGLTFRGGGKTVVIIALALLIYHLLTTLNGLFPYFEGGLGKWRDELSSLNSIREAKGFFAALLFLPLILAERRRGTALFPWFSTGMVIGLIVVSMAIAWERLLFTGLTNFTSSYRVSGPFFGIMTGGAAIDAYLVLVTPFVGMWLVQRLSLWTLWLSFIFSGLAAYSLYVTYSRADYPALLAELLVYALGTWLVYSRHRQSVQPWHLLTVVLFFAFAGFLSLHLYTGTTIAKRFTQTTQDLRTRFDHWNHALRIMHAYPEARWIGVGKGQFALEYYLDSIVAKHPLTAPEFKQTVQGNYISFTPGIDQGGVFLRQRLDPSAGDQYRLKLTLRAPKGNRERLLVEFCERHVLKYREECQWVGVNIPKGSRDWIDFYQPVNFSHLGKTGFGPFKRPVDISIMNRGIKQQIDIARVELHHESGVQIVQNSDFRTGLDHWFFSHADHLRWHVKNVFVYVYFEGGAAGLVLFILILLILANRLYSRMRRSDPLAVLLASAFTGLLFIGLFDSLFDDPRISFLSTLMLWLALLKPPSRINGVATRLAGGQAGQ